MIDVVIDYILAALDVAVTYLGSIINLFIALIWIFVVKKLNLAFVISLKLCLGLLLLSMFVTFFNLNEVAGIIAEYAFIFLLIGVVQWIFSKNNSRSVS